MAPRGLFNEIYRRFFRDKMISTAKHPVSNFVQAFLAATKDQDRRTRSASCRKCSERFFTKSARASSRRRSRRAHD